MTTTNIRLEAEELTTLLQNSTNATPGRGSTAPAARHLRGGKAVQCVPRSRSRPRPHAAAQCPPQRLPHSRGRTKRPEPSRHGPGLGEISDRMESLLDNVNEHSDPESHTHIESALGRLQDASELLSGRALPKDNPAPYDDE